MKQHKRILGWTIIAATAIWCLYEWLFVSDGPAYFAADWRRIALVAGLSVGGGLLALFFTRLPERMRRRIAIVTFGTSAVVSVAGCIYSIWWLFRLGDFLAEARILWVVSAVELIVCLVLGGVSVWLWREYRRRSEYKK
jgi:hypothetical protein